MTPASPESHGDRVDRVDRVDRDADVVVIGLGPGGLRAATLLADAGLDVVGVEQGLIGGECRFYGCTPSKMVVRAAELAAEARRFAALADSDPTQPQWRPVARRIAEEGVNGWDDGDTAGDLAKSGVTVIRGRGSLVERGLVAVGDEVVRARRGVVVATGTAPAVPEIDGLEQTPFLTNREVFRLDRLPRSMICVGGGPIGVELSQALSRLGVVMTMLEGADRILASEEPEASRVIAEAMRSEGVEVVEGVAVAAVRQTETGVRLTTGERAHEAERLLIASGRTTCVGGLGLDAVGIAIEDDVIPVDDRLRAAPGVWAIGDVTGKGPYTHVAEYQAEVAAADILDRRRAVGAEYHAVPRLVFAAPEVAAVGMTERDAEEDGEVRTRSASVGIDASSRAWLHDAGCVGFVKLVADDDTGCLLGATVVAPAAAEMIAQLTLAVHARMSLEQLGSMIYAFPTFHDAVRAAVRQLGVPALPVEAE
jgi:pyruvate/2-oxoglutarate dehydrogenase complex dihydrolipoamide dehydrogenase (E3) component